MSQPAVGSGRRIIILGGGLSGLSFAYYLRNFLSHYKKSNLIRKITILEANDYMGGSVRSHRFDDNLVHEMGPRSVRMSGPKAYNTLTLLDQLGLEGRVLTIDPKSSAGKDRYVYRDGKMWTVPSSLFALFKKLPASNTTLFRVVRNDFGNKKRMDLSPYPFNDPPLYDFVKYRFGEDAAEAVLDPLLRGITAGDCRKWSTRGIFGDFLAKEQTYGGIIAALGKPPVDTIEHDELYVKECLGSNLLEKLKKSRAFSFNLSTGLETLPEHLSNSLLNSNDDDVMAIYNRTKASSVQFNSVLEADYSPCSVVVQTVDGDQVKVDGDHVVAAVPACELYKMVSTQDSKATPDCLLALDYLSAIPHAPVGCVTVEYRNLDPSLARSLKSFGFLTHSSSDSRLLGIAFDSASFPSIDRDTGAFRMTCMMGGAWAEQTFGTTNMDVVTTTKLEQIALDEIRKIIKIRDEPHRMSAIMWKTGIAQYKPGHVELLKQTREKIKQAEIPLTLLGQSYDGIAVNDVIYNARRAAYEFAKSL